MNLITGRGSEIGDYLTTHPACSCISFTGGDTGLEIAKKVGEPVGGGVGIRRFMVHG